MHDVWPPAVLNVAALQRRCFTAASRYITANVPLHHRNVPLHHRNVSLHHRNVTLHHRNVHASNKSWL
jgi:hypothetical protein